jgi:hypothetical protein
MADDAELVSTVEWGAAPADRQTWMDRLTTAGAEPSSAPPAPRFRPNYVALGLAVVGFLVAAGAQYMPWVHIGGSTGRTSINGNPAIGGLDLHVSALPAGGPIVYGFSLVVGLVLLGYLLFADTNRRIAAAATVGAFAGNALALINISTSVATATGDYGTDAGATAGHLSSGFYLGLAAVLLFSAAAFVAAVGRLSAGTRGRRSRTTADGEEPLDLTVTGLGRDIG